MKSKQRAGLSIIVILLIVVATWWSMNDESVSGGDDGGSNSSSSDNSEGSDPKKKPNGSGREDKKTADTPSLELPAVTDESIEAGTSVSNTDEAQTVLNDKSKELGLGEDSELKVDSNSSDEYGNSYYHAGQYYKGIPIYGASSVLEVEQGEATVISGSWLTEFELDIEAKFDAKTALRKGLDVLGVPEERSVNELDTSRLIVYPSSNGMKLCWLMRAQLTHPDSASEIFVVDAHLPEILLRHEARLQ